MSGTVYYFAYILSTPNIASFFITRIEMIIDIIIFWDKLSHGNFHGDLNKAQMEIQFIKNTSFFFIFSFSV